MDRETKKTARSLMRLGDNPRLAVKTAKAGAKKSSASKAAYRKAYESVDQVDEGLYGKSVPKDHPLKNASVKNQQNRKQNKVDKNKQSIDLRKAKRKTLGKLPNGNIKFGESVDQVDENQDIKATAPKAKATKVGQRATTPSDMGRKYPDNKWVVKKNTATSKAYRPLEWVLESVEHLDELTQREKDMIADRKAKRDTKAGRKDKKTRLIPKTTTYVRPSKGEDDHIVMQLRRAQDSANFGNGSFGIRVSPVKDAATVNLKKPQIDKLLAVYDKLDKPDQKRKYRITLLKTLRSMQQKGK
jgi:hypothetical protein